MYLKYEAAICICICICICCFCTVFVFVIKYFCVVFDPSLIARSSNCTRSISLLFELQYVNCFVYGESPFEVSWLYSTDEISNRSSDYTIISGSKVSNIVYNLNSDDKKYVQWNSSLLLNPINNTQQFDITTVGSTPHLV